ASTGSNPVRSTTNVLRENANGSLRQGCISTTLRELATRRTAMDAPTSRVLLKIESVIIGERHRRDLGDIAALAASIKDTGLLHPIVVRRDGTLIAGERRLRAAELLGWRKIPVTVLDLDTVVKGEFAENTVRKDFTLSEVVAIKRTLEPLEKAA